MGQTCIAPDFILCTKETQEKLISKMKMVSKEWFGDNPQESKDLGRIISDRHFDRLLHLLNTASGSVAMGRMSIGQNLTNFF